MQSLAFAPRVPRLLSTPQPVDPAGSTAANLPEAVPFSVVLAYESMTAATIALDGLGGVLREVTEISPRLSAWHFALLDHSRWHQEAAEAIAAADLVVIATSNPKHPLPDAVEQWLKAGLDRARDAARAVAVLCHQGWEQTGDAPSPRVHRVQTLVDSAGGTFLSPSRIPVLPALV